MERVVPFLADTSGPFEQLLDAEQTAQWVQARIQKKKDAIRTIKKQAIDQDLSRNDFYGHIKQLEEDIRGFKRLLESNEASQNRWRETHMAAWRATIRPLKVVDLPNEILATIFAHFEDVPEPKIQVDIAPHDAVPLPSPDVASIKNIRLTCREFCDIGSRFLLPLVDISFTPSSIQRLENVSNHPTISKGVRVVQFYTGTYSSVLSNDHERFCREVVLRLGIWRSEFRFEKLIVRIEVEKAFRMIGIPPKPKFLKINGLQIALAEAEDIMEILDQHLRQGGHPVVPHDRFQAKISKAIAQAHDEYQQKYLEQQSLIEDCHLHAKIHAAICKMPSVNRLCLTDSSSRAWDDCIRSGWDQRLDAQKFKAIIKGPNPFRELMVNAGDYGYPLLEGDMGPERSLVYKLPLIFDVGNGNLTNLDISISAFDETHIEALVRHLQRVSRACQQLRRVHIKLTRPFRFIGTKNINPAFVAQTWELLSSMLISSRLEAIKLYFLLGSEFHDAHSTSGFGVVLGSLPWLNLRCVCLSHLPIKIGELRHALEKVPGKLHLELSFMNLLDGTWAEALEIIRGKVDSTSQIVNPRGVEIDAMSKREAQYFMNEFDSENRDGWCSLQRCPGPASFYIRGGNIPNPLIWGSD